MTARTRTLRWIEMLALFVGGPILLWRFPEVLARGLFLFLFLAGAACAVGLYFDKRFDRRKLWNARAVPPAIGWLLVRWLLASILLMTVFGLMSGREPVSLPIAIPTGLFSIFNRIVLPPELVSSIGYALSARQTPAWIITITETLLNNIAYLLPVAIFTFYPWVSVYPQNVIYRAFFCQRYRPILGGGWALIIINAAAFSFGHVMFNNWVVLALTFIGGLIFTRTYLKHRSLLLATIEHAMYGIFCFFLGIGVFLLLGASG